MLVIQMYSQLNSYLKDQEFILFLPLIVFKILLKLPCLFLVAIA